MQNKWESKQSNVMKKLDLAINDTSVIGNPVPVHELTKEE